MVCLTMAIKGSEDTYDRLDDKKAKVMLMAMMVTIMELMLNMNKNSMPILHRWRKSR